MFKNKNNKHKNRINKNRNYSTFLLHIASFSSLPFLATTALSETSMVLLEEVVVTAQKREQSAQDVPISISVLDADKIASTGIQTMEELTAYMPNIHFTETGFSTQVRVRGIGSDNSQGFEQSVGTYIDGIYYGRAQLFRAPFFDLERVELLRGPQSILFGKNSIAGALNLSAARPTDETQFKLSFMNEFEHDQQEIEGVINGALSDTFNARFAFRDYSEDGYFENTLKNRDESQADETAFRLSLSGELSDNLRLYLKAENNEFATIGRPVEITYDQSLNPSPLAPNYGQILQSLGQAPMESNQDFRRQYDNDETSDNTLNNVTAQIDYEHERFTLSFVTGYLDFEYDELCDCDNTPAEILTLELGEDYSQFSQEIRISSADSDKVEWIGGVFYQDWDQTFYDRLSISPTNFIPTVLSNLNFPDNAALALLADTGLGRDFEQNSESWAIFGQAVWHVNDQLRLNLGARYTEETKEAAKVLDLYTPSTDQPLVNPTLGLIYLSVFLAENEQFTALPWSGHNVRGERKEEAFTPSAGVEFDVADDVMLYASYSTGFKAGGFDPRSNSVGNLGLPGVPPAASEANPNRNFEFEEETADAYELGVKSRLFDGRAELNVSLYRTDYDDLQTSQFDGGVGFNVGNAKETRVQGIEVDSRWALTQNLQASLGFSWLDFEYLDFENGNCYVGEAGGTDINNDGLSDICDYTGKRGVYTPDYTLNGALDYEQALSGYLSLFGFIDAQHVDGHNVHVNLDPQGEIDAYTLVSARLGLKGQNWSLSLVGQNLLDEYIISYSANSPLSNSTFGTNTFYSVVRRPRTFAVEASLWF